MIDTHLTPVYVYSKQVQDNTIKCTNLSRKIDVNQVLGIISSLKQIGKKRDINDFEFQDNCKEWVYDILSNYPNNNELAIKYLLNDFTNSMMTRMREKDKFVLSIVSEGYLFLCHSSIGEKTITPFWKVADRMLDKDNVERFVIFHKEHDSIKVIYYEHSPSEFFTRWLGIPEKEAFFYLGGKNRLYFDIDGVHCVLELTDDDVENKLLNGASQFKVEKNQLIASSPINRLEVNQIRVGKKRYNSLTDFFQDYLARRYELSYYQNEYKKLAESLDVLTHAYFDDFDKVVAVSSEDGEEVKVKKRNPNFHILFSGRLISGATLEMRDSFFDRIFTDFLNGINVRIFHAGMNIYLQSQGPYQIGSLEIYNEMCSGELITSLLDFCQMTKIADNTLKNALYYSVFLLLSKTNETKALSYFFGKFANEMQKNIPVSDIIVQNENEIIEFKSRDYLVGKDDAVSKLIINDVKKKIKFNPFKIYIFGVEDKNKKIDPLASNKYSSDRIDSLQNKISTGLGDVEISLIKIPLDASDCLLLMLINKEIQQ